MKEIIITILSSEFIRRKRELTRLSGDFKKCLFEEAKKQNTIQNINSDIKNNWKTVALNGKVVEIDKEEKQEIEKFNSLYEERLLRYNQSQKKIIENKTEQSEREKEALELLSELDSTITELEDEKLKN